VTNPNDVWIYNLWAKLKLQEWQDEHFNWKTLIKNSNDISAPNLLWTYVKNWSQLIFEFDEPIFVDNYNSIFVNISWLSAYWVWDDYETHRKLFVNTYTQSWSTNYTFSLSWVKDINWNTKIITWSFIWYDKNTTKFIDYSNPYHLQQWKYYQIDVYGKNNIFNNIPPSVSLWSWINVSNIKKNR